MSGIPLSLGLGFRPGGGGATTGFPLDDFEADIIVAYGTQQLLSSYSGDFVTATSNRVDTWVDQGPNGYDATQATSANQPYYDAAADGVAFDRRSGGAAFTRYLDMDASAQVNRRNVSGYAVIEAAELDTESRFFSFGTLHFLLQIRNGGELALYGGAWRTFPVIPHTGKIVVGFICSPSAVDLYFNDISTTATGAAYGAATAGGGRVGYNTVPQAYCNIHELVLINDVLTTEEMDGLLQSAVSRHSIITTPTKKLITIGDSKTYAFGCEYAKPWPKLVVPDADCWIYNFAVIGRATDAWTSDLGVIGPLIDANTDIVLNLGTNDIGAQAQSGADAFADLEALVDALQLESPNRIAVCSLNGAADDVDRDAFNALLDADKAGADILINLADDADVGVTGSTLNDASNFVDSVHENQLGQARIAALVTAGLY